MEFFNFLWLICTLSPVGSYRGLSFYVGAKGRYWSKKSNRKLEISIVVKLASQPDSMLNEKRNVDTYKNNFVNSYRKNIELNENFHSTIHKSFQRKTYFRKYVSFYSVQRNFAYWLETQPINHNKELDAYTISVHSRSGYFRQFHF